MYPQGDGPRHKDVVVTSPPCPITAVGAHLVLHHLVTRISITLDVCAVTHHCYHVGDDSRLGAHIGMKSGQTPLASVTTPVIKTRVDTGESVEDILTAAVGG